MKTMNLVEVACQNCGAPLQVTESASYVTCAFCHTQLAVVHTGSAHFTEQMQKIAEGTQAAQQNLEIIRLQNELEQMDREFQIEREDLQTSGKHGKSDPSRVGGILGLVIGVPFTLFWIGMAASMKAPFFFPLFGVLFLIGIVYICIREFSNSNRLDEVRESYHTRRGRLLAEIARLQSNRVKSPRVQSNVW